MTDQQTQVVERFRAWCQVQGLTQAAAARRLNISTGIISRMYTGKYGDDGGNVGRMCAKMVRFLDREARKRSAPKRPPFAATSVTESVIGTLSVAHDECVMALVMGPTGAGKTTAIRQYLLAEPECISISAVPSMRSRALIALIARSIGVAWQGSTSQMLDACAERLRGTGRLIIVDEVDYLHEPCLQELRMLHDMTGCGLALVGTLAFRERLQRRNSSTIGQFLGRLAYAASVDGISDTDAEEILAPFGLARDALSALARGCDGSARRLVWAVASAQREAGQAAISTQHVTSAYQALLSA